MISSPFQINIVDHTFMRCMDLSYLNFLSHIDPIHKWLPMKNYFVSIKISPTNLVLELIIQKNFYFQTRLVGLI